MRTKLQKLLSLLLCFVMVAGMLPAVTFAATYGDQLAQTAANSWQIVNGGYTGNGPSQKTTFSNDGMVRVQKNVVPTATENEFQVYLSLDTIRKKVATYENITGMLQLNLTELYCGGTGNGFPKKNDDVRTGNGSLNNGVQGGIKPIVLDPNAPFFTIQIWYGNQLIAEPKLQLCVPNSALYLMVGTQFIALENIQLQGGDVYVGGVTPPTLPDGSFLVPVHLTDMAYNALFQTIVDQNTEEICSVEFESGVSITDTMGPYIVYDGFEMGDIISGTAPPAAAEAGTTVYWSLQPKPESERTLSDPVVTVEETTVTSADGSVHLTRITTTTQWCLNPAEVVYNVHLDVTKAGFTSGTVYDVNSLTVLNYNDIDENGNLIAKSLTFPVPQVKGTLYNLPFRKVDSVTKAELTGAVFSLRDAGNNYWPATQGGTENGEWSFEGLPCGTYVLTELVPPAGYTLPDPASWTLTIGYTDDLKDGNVTDHIHNEYANDVFIGNKDPEDDMWLLANEKQSASLTISKTFTGEASDLSDAHKNSISFRVTGPDNFERILSYEQFIDGSLTFGVPPGMYTVEETVPALPGYEVQTSYYPVSGQVTLANGGAGSVAVTNHYTKHYASLTISKSFIGDTEELEDAYKNNISFRVTGSGGFDETVTYAAFDKTNNTYTFPSVPPGTYTVEETNAGLPGYLVDTEYSHPNGTITLVNDDVQTVTVTNDYDKQSASLTIKKIFDGDMSVLTDEYKNGISFAVTGPIGFDDTTITYADFDKNTNTYTFPSVPLGEYTVLETNADLPGYAVWTGYNPANGTITLADDDVGIVEITNTYDQQSADLTIRKSFTGDVNELTDAYKNAISFTVTRLGGLTKIITFGDFANDSDGDDNTYTFYDVPLGDYTVSETNTALEGYEVETTYDPPGGTITLADNDAKTVTVTNTYDKQSASLTITKAFTGDACTCELPDTYKNNISFTVTGLNGFVRTISFAEFTNGSFTFEVPPDTYTVTESNTALDHFLVETTYDPTGGTITLIDDDVKTVTVTNDYDKQTSNLIIKKVFAGEVSGLTEAYKDAIKFTVSGPENFTIDIWYSFFAEDDTYTFYDVPLGEYTVVETNADLDGYHVQTAYSHTDGRINLEKGVPGTVTVTNTYRKHSAKLTITKSFDGDKTEPFADHLDKINGITFIVTGPGFNKTVTYGEFNEDSNYIFTNVPVGEYTVMESLYNNIPGYLVTSSIVEGYTITLEDGDDETVSVNNHYDKQSGDLTITKTFAGDKDGLTEDDKNKIKFFIKGLNSGYEKTVTYADFGGSNSYTLSDIPLDEYTVSESNANVTGYVVTASYDPVDGIITLEHDNQSVEVKITNTYNIQEGGLVLQKTFTGDVLTDGQKAGITFTVYDSEGNAQHVIPYSDFQNDQCIINNISLGTYTIKETKADFDGYIRDTKYSTDAHPLGDPGSAGNDTIPGDIAEIVITDGNAHYVEFINDYDKQAAKLTITKVFEGDTIDLPAAYKNDISFIVKDSENNTKYNIPYSDFTIVDLNTVRYVINDVPLGTYTVTETLPDEQNISDKYEYIVTSEYIPEIPTITLEDDDNREVKIINTYDKQSTNLTIIKEFTGDIDELTSNYKNSVSFTVTGPAGFEPQNITYSQFIDGKHVLNDVPAGQYTVTETLPVNQYISDNYIVTTEFSAQSGIIDLADDIPGEVKITNNYNKQEGGLVLQKSFTGHSLTDAQKSGITFTVFNSLGDMQSQFSYNNFQNGQYVLNKLKPGVYSIVESVADFEGYVRSSEYKTGSRLLSQTQPPVMGASVPVPADNEIEIEITDDYAHYVEFINDYDKQSASLTIKKVFAGDEGELTDAYKNAISFTVTGPTGFEDTTITYDKFDEDNDGNNDTYTFDDVPLGDYTVTESNFRLPGYVVQNKYNSGGVDYIPGDGVDGVQEITLADDDEVEVVITNTYTRLTSLTITKVFTGDDVGKLTDAYKNAISFTVTGPNNFNQTVTYEHFNNKITNSHTFTDVPAGEYAVTETLPDPPAGYHVQTGYSHTDGKITLAKGVPGTVMVTNTYAKQVSALTITKVFAGETSGLTDEYKNAISFTVTGPNNFKETVTYGDFNGDSSHTFQNISVGEYMVVETLPDPPAGYKVQTGYNPENRKITLAEDVPGTVTVTNTYSKQLSTLTITKVFAGDLSGLNDTYKNAISFTVTGPNNFKETVTYGDFSGGSSHTFENVLVGTYTVTENNAALDGFNVQTEYSSENGEITLVENVPGTVTVTNTYSKKLSTLIITKVFAGETGGLNDTYKNAISFNVKGPTGFTERDVTYADFDKTSNSYTLSNVPVGEYTVVETLPETPAGFNVQTAYNPGSGKITLKESVPGTVTVTNTYSKQVATLTITKVFAGETSGLTDEYKNAISFTVTGPNNFKETVTYGDFNGDSSHTFQNISVGEYMVAEILPETPAGYHVQTGYSHTDGKITLADGTTGTVTVINTYSKQVANLTIKKVFAGEASGLTDAYKNAISFTVTGLNGYTNTVTYGQFNKTTHTYTITNVPVGECTVAETLPETPAGYKVQTEYSTENGKISLTEGVTGTLTVTNTYRYTESSYEIPFTKTVIQGGNTAPGRMIFKLEILDIDSGSENAYADVTVSAEVETNGQGEYNGKMTISGPSLQVWELLSKGFYVREKNTGAAYWTYSNAVWYVKSADNTKLNLRIYPAAQLPNGYYDYSSVEDPAEKMTFTNIYTYNHSSNNPPDPSPDPSPDNVVHTASSWTLTLTKVDSNDNSYKLPGAKFDLYRVGSTIDTKVGSYITDSSGVAYATVSVSGDYYWVETQPPTGYTLDTTRRYTSTGFYGKSIVVENKKTETPTILNGKDHIAYVIGYPNGLVLPGGQITRGEVTTIFFRLLNEDVRNANYTKDNNFLDVNRGDWFNAAISTMAKMGIVKGYPDGNFCPNDPITRAEFVAIAARFDNSTVSTSADFGDVKGHWAEIEIGKVTANGWVNGYLDNTFKPDQNITRAEAMALINRVLNRNPETPYDLLDDMIKWPDNMDTTRWYYLDVQEATNSHDYMRKSNNTERWIKINPPRDWAALEK